MYVLSSLNNAPAVLSAIYRRITTNIWQPYKFGNLTIKLFNSGLCCKQHVTDLIILIVAGFETEKGSTGIRKFVIFGC